MIAVCCCGGRGKRLGSIGNYLSKPMYPIVDKPFVAYAVDQLVDSGIASEIVMVVGWRAEQVQTYFGSNYRGIPIQYTRQNPPSGTGAAISNAFTAFRFQEPIVAWLGDIYVSKAQFRTIANSPQRTAITLFNEHCDCPHARVLVADGRVKRCWPTAQASPLIDIGLWKLSPECMARLSASAGGECRTLQAVQRQIDDGIAVGYGVSDKWIHLGNEPSTAANLKAVWHELTEE